jgi:membrane-associated phospholipid phosphatase
MRSLTRSPWAWLPPLLALVLFAAIAATGTNQTLFLVLNRAGHVCGDAVWTNLTMLGDGAVLLALVLPWIRRAPRCFWAALIAAVLAALWVQLTKQVINVPRPLAVFVQEPFFQAGPPYRAVSFPSGHAAGIFALTGIWVMSLRRHYLLRTLLLMLALLVSLSRVMVGVHWPLDILWGMLGGWLAAWVGLAVSGRMGWNTSNVPAIAAGVVLMVVAGALLVSHHIGIPAALPLQRALGGVCLLWGTVEMVRLLPRLQLRRDQEGD